MTFSGAVRPSILLRMDTAWARVTGELGAKVPSPKPEIHPWAAAELMASAAQKLSFTSLKELSPVVSKVLKAMAMLTNSARVISCPGAKVPSS